MIQKAITLILSLFVLMSPIIAQHAPCGYDIILKNIGKDKEYSEDVRNVFDNAVNDKSIDRFEEIYVIPITFHVVWKDTIENIDDSLILQQIEVLNENYRRLNANADEIRDEFMDIVGDANIEFELSEIIRVHTDTTFEVDLFGGLIDYVKHTNDGGSDAIDVETNLNVWVCDIKKFSIFGQEGKLLGYSYPPTGLSHWPPDFFAPSPELDGVVMDFRVIGRNNPNIIEIPGLPEPLQTEGRTLVHEVGHYLGLRHTWGDAQFGEDGCTLDDGVDDTPNCYGSSNFDCLQSKNSCDQNQEGDLPDMIENFMDYSTEACMNSFTNGQIGIMRSVLRNVRCKLVGDCLEVSNSDIQRNDVQLFPNPASDIVTIQGDFDESTAITIYNSLGIVIRKENQIDGNTINVSDLSRGLYFFEIGIGEQQVVKKMVLR